MRRQALAFIVATLLGVALVYSWNGDTWGPITRQQIVSIAAQMMDSTWSPSANIVNYDGSTGRNYYVGTTYTGELYTNSAHLSWSEFFNAVSTTSGGNTYYGNNCDGFVNMSWRLPKFYSIPAMASNLGGAYFFALGEFGDAGVVSLLPGDAFYERRQGHIFLFSKYNPDGTIQTMEQVQTAARRRTWSWNALQNYRPIRRKLLSDSLVINDRIQTFSDASIKVSPTFASNSISIALIASQGTIVDGPIDADQYRWWKVQFDGTGTVGWLTEGRLKRLRIQNLPCTNATPPTGGMTINSNAQYANSTAVLLTLSSLNPNSPCAWMRFSTDNINWSPWEGFTNFKNWSLSTGDGPKPVYVQFANACGNLSGIVNKTIILQTPTPDLVVSSLSAPTATSAGATISVGDITANVGSGGANTSTTSFFFSSDTTLDAADALVGSRSIPALATGANNAGTTSITLPSNLSPGIFLLIAKANSVSATGDCNYIIPCGSMIETSRNNNTRVIKISIGPDLIVSGLKASVIGTTVSIRDTVTNIGGDPMGSCNVSFYLSADATLNTTDTFLARRTVPALAPGASSSATTSSSIPSSAPSGTYYIIARADASNTVVEANENNNTKSTIIKIVQ